MASVVQILLETEPEHILPAFKRWVDEQRALGARLVILEGLPGAGKSTLTRTAGEGGIDLDEFLPDAQTDGETSWLDLVLAGGAINAVCAKLSQHNVVVVCGVQAAPALEAVARELGSDAVRRVYIKRVTVLNGQVFWDDGVGLLEHAATSRPYFKSIYEHHGRERPWHSADLVIERVDRD